MGFPKEHRAKTRSLQVHRSIPGAEDRSLHACLSVKETVWGDGESKSATLRMRAPGVEERYSSNLLIDSRYWDDPIVKPLIDNDI
jgi:hypothetical protein